MGIVGTFMTVRAGTLLITVAMGPLLNEDALIADTGVAGFRLRVIL